MQTPHHTFKQQRRDNLRTLKDIVARYLVGAGGISVIAAIVLIFVYLLSVVYPIFNAAKLEPLHTFQAPGGGDTLYLGIDEQFEIGVRINHLGELLFFDLSNGETLSSHVLPVPDGASISSFAEVDARRGWFALGLDDGTVLVASHQYRARFVGDTRYIDPVLVFPLGEETLEVSEQGDALQQLAVGNNEEQITFVARVTDGLQLATFLKEEGIGEDSIEAELEETSVFEWPLEPLGTAQNILLDPEQQTLYTVTPTGVVSAIDVSDKAAPTLVETTATLAPGETVTASALLLGGFSLLIADDKNTVSQWFPVRDAQGVPHLQKIRYFDADNDTSGGLSRLTSIAIEQRRKGFITADSRGGVSILHTTAQRHIASAQVSEKPLARLVVSPRSNGFIAEDTDRQLHVWSLHSEHPEISWQALWQKVWYESFEQPEYLWQSSASNNDFEPKLSLAPLTFGTLKAAFYAMLFAVPLAICGAIYTAYFMSAAMRRVVKPTIEIMEALPTVILGFLAGLWLAPLMEKNLMGVWALLLLLPLAVLLFGYACSHLPAALAQRLGSAWYAALLIPVVVAVTWLAFAVGPLLEGWLPGGNAPQWLDSIGITFDQRNALVVGVAMGFAVIPTIFSISEDAIFGVPKHLSVGSLALGATPWQTLSRVVILTASPGIFSAVMIGLGRAVGETMIVLMATGNTPIMDFNIFEGMRTLSANIAVEMPESELGSSHYRILFLAALVLFIVTFLFNTVAELVRQRLREKYSNL